MRWEAVAVVAVLVVLSFSSFLPVPQSSGSTPIAPAASQSLTTYTTPLSLTFAQKFSGGPHLDIPPSPFRFDPNGTVRLFLGASSLVWTFAVIPLQAPTSFQANSTYVIYSAKGPGPNCFVNFAYKEGSQASQQGNVAFVNIFGTAAQPCASSTFSIKLSSYGGQLQALNSTGGTAGTICDVKLAAIEWSWCHATLTSATISYSAGTIQFRNTASAWSILDPIAIDSSDSCSHAGGSATCTTGGMTTVSRNDLLLMFQWTSNGPPDCEAQTQTSSPAITWRERNNVGGSGSELCEYYAQWDSSGLITTTCNQATTGKGGCFIIAISDAMIKPPSFDTGLCANQRALTTTTTTTINACPLTSYNKRDLMIGAFGLSAQNPTITAGSGFSLVGCRQANGLSICVEDQLVSSVQTNTQAQWVDVTNSGNNAWFLSDTVEEFKPDIVQVKACTLTGTAGGSSLACAFANNLVAGDSVLVLTGLNTTGVSSVTDTQSLTYSAITSEAASAGSYIQASWACNVATSAADTVTSHFSAAARGAVVIYELTPSDAACTVRSSTGFGATGTAGSVTSYTPLNASLVIGGHTPQNDQCAFAGSGYDIDSLAASVPCMATEHATNNGTAETTPFTMANTAWNEISMSFVRPTPNALVTTTTIEPIGCTASTTIPQTNTALFSTTLSSTQPLTLSSTESETSTLSGTLLTTSTRVTSQSKMTTTITIPITLSTTSTVSETETLTEQTTFSQTIPVTQGTTSSTTQSLTLTCTGASATATITSTTSTTTTSPTTTTVTTGGGGGKADPPNFDWLLLIPVFFVLFYLIARRR